MHAVIEEKDDVVRAKADLEDDWDVALEEAQYAAVVWVRDAAAKENASRRITFAFFDDMFRPLDDVSQAVSLRAHLLAEAAHSTNRPFDGESGVPPPGVDEEQVDFGSE